MKLPKYALFCAVRITIELVIGIALLLLFLSLLGCKTPSKVERTVQVDSISVSEVMTASYDSLMQRILSSLTFDFEYSLIEWSKPDSSGTQYKEKEHHLKASGVAETETQTVRVVTETEVKRDSIQVNRQEKETVTPVETKSWWDKLLIKVGIVAIVIAAVYFVVKKFGS